MNADKLFGAQSAFIGVHRRSSVFVVGPAFLNQREM
jgi:hypothetical protein